MFDNITSVSYINNKGRIKSKFCNEIAIGQWVWCTSQNMWISAAHTPGTQNTETSSFSRNFNEAIEWKLSSHLFQKIPSMSGNPTLDLVVSRINHQIDRYISWIPDPKALAIDAFSIKWNTEFYYIFPPFSLLGKVTEKVYRDKTKVIVVIPKWPTQHWYSSLWRKATRSMIITPSAKNLLQSQDPQKVHPLDQKLHLQVLLID